MPGIPESAKDPGIFASLCIQLSLSSSILLPTQLTSPTLSRMLGKQLFNFSCELFGNVFSSHFHGGGHFTVVVV